MTQPTKEQIVTTMAQYIENWVDFRGSSATGKAATAAIGVIRTVLGTRDGATAVSIMAGALLAAKITDAERVRFLQEIAAA